MNAKAGYHGRRDFRSGRGMVLLNVGVALLFASGALMTYVQRGWYWVSIGLACAVALGIGAIAESVIVRVQLADEVLIVTDLRGTRSYPRCDIARVEEAKGSPTFAVLTDGRAVKLPAVGSSIGNSIRAWLKQ